MITRSSKRIKLHDPCTFDPRDPAFYQSFHVHRTYNARVHGSLLRILPLFGQCASTARCGKLCPAEPKNSFSDMLPSGGIWRICDFHAELDGPKPMRCGRESFGRWTHLLGMVEPLFFFVFFSPFTRERNQKRAFGKATLSLNEEILVYNAVRFSNNHVSPSLDAHFPWKIKLLLYSNDKSFETFWRRGDFFRSPFLLPFRLIHTNPLHSLFLFYICVICASFGFVFVHVWIYTLYVYTLLVSLFSSQTKHCLICLSLSLSFKSGDWPCDCVWFVFFAFFLCVLLSPFLGM